MKDSNEKICLIYQPVGIGDVFFCQAIARNYLEKGYRVIWPLESRVLYIRDYVLTQGVELVDIASDFPGKEKYLEQYNDPWKLFPFQTDGDFIILPLNNAQHRVSSSLMIAKYDLVGLNFEAWRDSFNFCRNYDRENALFYDKLGLSDKDEYVFVNRKFGTPPDFHQAPFKVDTDLKIVEMEFIPGDNPFDWLKVIENASAVVTVDTSFQYLMEKLDNLKGSHFYCYPRSGESSWIPLIDKIFTRVKWQYFTS